MSERTIKCAPVIELKKGGCKGSHNWEVIPEKVIGKGVFGSVQAACCNSDCSYVAKHVMFGRIEEAGVEMNKEDFRNEFKIQEECAKEKLCVPIKDAWECEHGGMIIMPAMYVTVEKLLFEYPSITIRIMILARVMGMIERLHNIGIYHGDTQLHNIMARYDKDLELEPDMSLQEKWDEHNYRFRFIDLGLAKTKEYYEDISVSDRDDRLSRGVPINSKEAVIFDYEVLSRYLEGLVAGATSPGEGLVANPLKYIEKYRSEETEEHFTNDINVLITYLSSYVASRFYGRF